MKDCVLSVLLDYCRISSGSLILYTILLCCISLFCNTIFLVVFSFCCTIWIINYKLFIVTTKCSYSLIISTTWKCGFSDCCTIFECNFRGFYIIIVGIWNNFSDRFFKFIFFLLVILVS